MPRELEDSEDSEHSESNERTRHIVIVRDAQSDVVRQDGHHVYNAHHPRHELVPVGGGEEPQEVLGRKNHHARRVQTEEHYFVAFTTRDGARFAGSYPTRDRFDHVGHHGDGDEETGYVVEYQG